MGESLEFHSAIDIYHRKGITHEKQKQKLFPNHQATVFGLICIRLFINGF